MSSSYNFLPESTTDNSTFVLILMDNFGSMGGQASASVEALGDQKRLSMCSRDFILQSILQV
jgi:hypothetical protein